MFAQPLPLFPSTSSNVRHGGHLESAAGMLAPHSGQHSSVNSSDLPRAQCTQSISPRASINRRCRISSQTHVLKGTEELQISHDVDGIHRRRLIWSGHHSVWIHPVTAVRLSCVNIQVSWLNHEAVGGRCPFPTQTHLGLVYGLSRGAWNAFSFRQSESDGLALSLFDLIQKNQAFF